MRILQKIRRRIRRASMKPSKDSLSVVSTCDETFNICDNNKEETYILFSEDPLSLRKGHITTSSIPKSDRDNIQLHLSESKKKVNQFDFGFDSCKEEGDDVRLLASPTSNRNGNSAYAFDQYEEEIIFEPSFEVALTDPATLWLGSPKGVEVSEEEGTSSGASHDSSDKCFTDDDVLPLPLPLSLPLPLPLPPPPPPPPPLPPPSPLSDRKPKPETRYDLYGQPFVHSFHEGLSTLYEESANNKSPLAVPPVATRSKLESGKLLVPDDVKIRARWDLALEEMSSGVTCDWDGILSPRSGIRSSYEI